MRKQLPFTFLLFGLQETIRPARVPGFFLSVSCWRSHKAGSGNTSDKSHGAKPLRQRL
jgi:hypothetical protein